MCNVHRYMGLQIEFPNTKHTLHLNGTSKTIGFKEPLKEQVKGGGIVKLKKTNTPPPPPYNEEPSRAPVMLHVTSNLCAVNLSTGLLRSVGWELFKEEISVKLLELSQELMKDGRMQYHGAFKIYAGISPDPWCFFYIHNHIHEVYGFFYF